MKMRVRGFLTVIESGGGCTGASMQPEVRHVNVRLASRWKEISP
jgi:hypothetical protein